MKTFERTHHDSVAELELIRSRRRPYAKGIAVVVLVGAVSAFVAYAAASPHTITKTKTKTVYVATKTPATVPAICAPGAAPGSCNIDEARAALIPDQPLDSATRAQLAAQLVAARAAALKYPT